MPTSWAQVDAQFPTFTGNETAAEAITQLLNYMFSLTEQLKYALRNLDTTNFNATSLKEFTDDTATPIIEALETLTARVNGIAGSQSTISQRVESLAEFPQRVTDAEQDIDGIDGRLQRLEDAGLVTKTELQTSGGTQINPENIQQGEMTGIDVEGGLSVPQGKEVELQDGNGDALGTLSADAVKLILAAGAAFGMLLQAGGNIWITSGGDITITGTNINLVGTVKVNGTEIGGGE